MTLANLLICKLFAHRQKPRTFTSRLAILCLRYYFRPEQAFQQFRWRLELHGFYAFTGDARTGFAHGRIQGSFRNTYRFSAPQELVIENSPLGFAPQTPDSYPFAQ